jgi:type I restriction enzyme S subunit
MKNWTIQPLSSLTNNLDNKRIPLNEGERALRRGIGKYPYFGANNELDRLDEYIFDEKILCVAEDGGSWGSNQKCAYIFSGKCWVNNHAHVLTAKPNVSLEYLKYYLNRVDLSSFITGTTRGKLTRSALDRIQVPLPSYAEQQRIADILGKADAVRANRRQTIAKLDALLQSVFLDMFGDPALNKKGWPKLSLVRTAEIFRDGPFGSNLKTSHYRESGVRVIRLQNIGVGEFLDSDKVFISEDHFRSLPGNHCRPGDVLIGTLGDPNLRACVLPENVRRALNKADCVLLRPDRQIANAHYLTYLLNSPSTLRMASGLILGETRMRISMGRLRELSVPVPPLELQNQFLGVVNVILQQKINLWNSIHLFDNLVHSLQQRAFNGELFAETPELLEVD